jgi:hypothetical protein
MIRCWAINSGLESCVPLELKQNRFGRDRLLMAHLFRGGKLVKRKKLLQKIIILFKLSSFLIGY